MHITESGTRKLPEVTALLTPHTYIMHLLSMSDPVSELSIRRLPTNFSVPTVPSRAHQPQICLESFLLSSSNYCPVLFKYPQEASDWSRSVLLAGFLRIRHGIPDRMF